MDKEIYLVGAGHFGRKMVTVFEREGYRIKGIADNYFKLKNESGINVISLDEMRDSHCEIFLCVRNYYSIGNIIRQLFHIGITKVWVVDPSVYESEVESIQKCISCGTIYFLDYSYKAVVPKMEFHIIDCCNLNCKGCSHFAPIFLSGKVKLEEFERQLSLLKSNFATIFRFRIMGGEPFLHDKIGDFALLARQYFPYTHLEIVTNGLLYNSVTDENWEKIHDAKATLNISLYPPTFQIKEEIEALLCEKEVAFSFGSGLEQYNDSGIIEEFHKCLTMEKRHDADKAIQHCVGSYCHYLRDGKISKCSLPLLIDRVNEYFGTKWEVERGDVWDLTQDEEPWKMTDMLAEATPFCKYCVDDGILERFIWEKQGPILLKDYIVEGR